MRKTLCLRQFNFRHPYIFYEKMLNSKFKTQPGFAFNENFPNIDIK